MDLSADVADQYREFAGYADSSPCYQRWASQVAGDDEIIAWIEDLPWLKRQPNLVFGAARWHGVAAPGPYAGFRAALLGDAGPIRATIMARSTQTNEVGRLATLMPAFWRIYAQSRQPLSLLEVGASAGLCLYPDRYDYRWQPRDAGEDHARTLRGRGGPELTCTVRGNPDRPTVYPPIAARAGIDLNPLDVADPDATAWLANLVWPEETRRRARLEAAVEIVRACPPVIAQGDLLEELPQQIERAAAYGEVVVFHSAVISYLEPSRQREFADLMRALVRRGACRWVSNEGKNVLPEVTATGPPIAADHSTFVLGLDAQALAWTHGHGSSMTWLS